MAVKSPLFEYKIFKRSEGPRLRPLATSLSWQLTTKAPEAVEGEWY